MLWHRQAIFESKGDKLFSSAECRIRTQRVSETQSSADWMPADKPAELSRIKLKNLNSTAKQTDQLMWYLQENHMCNEEIKHYVVHVFIYITFFEIWPCCFASEEIDMV